MCTHACVRAYVRARAGKGAPRRLSPARSFSLSLYGPFLLPLPPREKRAREEAKVRARCTRVQRSLAPPLPPFALTLSPVRRVRAAGKYRLSLKLPRRLTIDSRHGRYFRAFLAVIVFSRRSCTARLSRRSRSGDWSNSA